MGYAPIGARGERLGGRSMGVNGGGDGSTIRKIRDGDAGMGDVVQAPRGVEVEEVSIPSGKGGMLSGIVVRKEGKTYGSNRDAGDGDSEQTVLVYFQGVFLSSINTTSHPFPSLAQSRLPRTYDCTRIKATPDPPCTASPSVIPSSHPSLQTLMHMRQSSSP